ncbi:hypothetical protein Mapa_017247 [Marchantia paleacea]|nr:hypothetical protein Mapa_017247 [Marchantia paleacea]
MPGQCEQCSNYLLRELSSGEQLTPVLWLNFLQSFKAWRVKVCIAQSDPSVSPLPAPRLITSAPVRSEPSRSPPGGGKPPAVVCSRLKQLLMDVGVSPSASPNPKVSKPSLGVRVLRTLFDNSPPTYTSTKSQAATNTAAAQAKEQQRKQELLKAQGAKNGNRTPTPQSPVEEPQVAWRESTTAPNVIEKLAEKSGRFPPGLKKSERKVAHAPSRASLVSESLSSLDSHEDAHSSVSTDFEYDSSFNRYHDKEVRNMNRSAVRDHEDDYELGSGHVDDSVLPDLDANLDSAQKLEHLKQEIERLRFENLVLKQRGVASERHPYRNDSDLSRASSVTEVSNSEEASEEWIPYAEYHPSTVGTASVARFHGAQPNGYRRNEMPRHPPGERYFPGEHAARAFNAGGGHGSSSETVSMVTDGSRASSRHHSGLLNENEPQSGLTSRHNSGLRSDMEDLPSMMSWDGSRHNSGPMVVDRNELYGLTTPNSSIHSRTSSGMLVDEPLSRGGTMTPLGGNSRENSRHNSGMQVDREGRGIPQGLLLSPRISFEGKPLPVAVPISLPLPLSSSSVATINTVEETFSHHRVYTRERHLVETDSRNNNSSKHSSDVHKYNDEYDDDDHGAHPLQVTNRGSSRNNNNGNNKNDNIHSSSGGGMSRGTSAAPPMATQAMRSYENHETPSRTTTPPPNYAEQYEDFNDEGVYRGGQRTNNPSPPIRRAPTPPKSRRSQSEESDLSDTTNSSMFSYQQPSAVPSMITVPRSRSANSQKSNEDLSQFLLQQGQQSLSMDSSQINTTPRSRSTHSQMSTEESSTVQNQHQSTLERLMVSQQRRQNMSGTTPMSMNASPEQQYSSKNSRQIQTKSPYRR